MVIELGIIGRGGLFKEFLFPVKPEFLWKGFELLEFELYRGLLLIDVRLVI